jgi:hypothetical protein
MALTENKDVKYPLDTKEVILAPKDVPMLCSGVPMGTVPTFSQSEFKLYNLKTLREIGDLLGIPTANIPYHKLMAGIRYYLDEESWFFADRKSKTSKLMLLKDHSDNTTVLMLFDQGRLMAQQTWIFGLPGDLPGRGRLIVNNEYSEDLDIIRDYSLSGPDSNYLCDECFVFRKIGVHLLRSVREKGGKYYVTYLRNGKSITKQEYEFILATQTLKLTANK